MSNPTDRRNALASGFVRQVGHGTASSSEVCVVLESIILGAMKIIAGLYGASPAVASGLVEAAVQRAIERFSSEAK